MSLDELTHAWVEAPFYSDSLDQLPAHVEVLYPAETPDEPYANAQPAQAIFASSLIRYDAAFFEKMPNVKIVQRTGIGMDNVNLEDATAYGVAACNTPDGPTASTAEHTVALLLNLAKRVKQGNDNLAQGKFGPRIDVLIGSEVRGKVLGLVGLGRIGRRVAEICMHGLGMTVLAYDPYVTDEAAEEIGVEIADLDTVIQQADFLSMHAPVTPDTVHLMNAKRIGMMKDSAYLLNLARGPLVESAALLEAVDSGKLAGAGIDVFEPEPPEIDSSLRNHPLIVATPHAASLTVDGRVRIEEMAVASVFEFFEGKRPANLVNADVWESSNRRG